jgi:CubicO group peptidase (beta-lactamase class C family)
MSGKLAYRDISEYPVDLRCGGTMVRLFAARIPFSQSMARTLTGLLVGIAVSEGAIHSIDDTAATYVPEMAGTEYGATPLSALLHMSSGVAFREQTYEPDEDIINLHKALLGKDAVGATAALRQFNTRDAPPNTRLAYASSETEVLGLVVSRAVHMPLADYLATRIWQKLGAESDAAWAIDATGQEVAYCCFIATLRDWARLGLMLANDGAWNGQDMEDGVQRDIDAFKKTRDDSRS